MNQTQKGVLIAIVVFLLGSGAYVALKPNDARVPEAMKDAAGKVAETGKAAGNMLDLGAAVDKTGRLIADAGAAANAMKDLYKDGKVPAAPDLTEARGKIEAALNGIMAVEVPADATGAPADMLKRARDTAAKALDILKTLPTDADGAVAALTDLNALLTAEPATPPLEDTAPAPAPSPAAPAEAAADTKSDTAAVETAPEPAATEPAATAEPAPAPSAETVVNAPAFDLLRVEPDGSTVIAGRARDGDRIEILDGDTVVASAQANVGGDFAAVFDKPLSPGDHQLTIRATAKDGTTVTSSEVATVSVPKDQSGQLLAMVSKPGEASRVITAPISGSTPATGAAAQQPATETEASTVPATAKAALQISAVEVEGDRIFVAGTADPGSKVSAYADDKLIAADETSADGHFVIDGTMPLSVGQHRIRVDQLGADGQVAFRAEVPFDRPEGAQVAAVATPAGTDSGQASAMHLLGDGAFDAARSVALKAFNLLQGLFADGKVPSAEQYAAARSGTEIALQALIDFVPPADADAASRDLVAKTRENAQKALSLMKAMPADPAGAGTALSAIEALIREAVAPADGGASPTKATASAAAEPTPAKAPAPAPATDPAVATTAEQTAAAPAPEEPATSHAGTDDTGPTTVAQAPLKESTNTVIIRKGDTLWQISRRVYGLGVRYTTIYLANRQQIANPDRILPGQVFGVPEKALPNAEELHRQRMHGDKIQ